jgi:hypothetical protein
MKVVAYCINLKANIGQRWSGEHGDEPSGSIIGGEFCDQLNNFLTS